MYASKLLELIRALEKPELERVIKFLNSPYFGKMRPPKEVHLLLNHILSCFPAYQDPSLSKENTYTVLYPGEPFVVGKVDRVMSDLLKIIKEFIVYEFSDIRDNEVQRLLIQARFYRQRHMEKPFHRAIKSLRAAQKKAKETKDFYWKQFLIEKEISKFESFYNHRKKDLNVPSTLKSLDIFYLVNKLEYTCWLLAQDKYSNPLNVEDSLLVFDQIISSFKEGVRLDEIPLLKVYYHGIRLIQSDEESDQIFRQLSQILEQYASVIPLERLKELQTVCRNYCILQYNNGKEEFLEEAFHLYRNHLEQGYLHYEGGLLPSTIRNIVAVGLRLKKYDWVYDFLEEYKDRIVASNQPREIYLFNLANYYFARKKYAEALDCLVDRYEDPYYLLAAKRMELKVYYELESEILESKIDAFKIYIYRTSPKVLLKVLREGNNNFIDLLKQIRSPKTLHSETRINKLRQKIHSKKSIAEKEWLLEKLEEYAVKFRKSVAK